MTRLPDLPAGPFEPAWASLERYEVPRWYQDGKFGIFIHWGLYAVPGYGNEWYPRNMYQQDRPEFAHHVHTYGPQDRFGYKDFIPLFKAERYDPDAWAELFRRAGAKFVVPVAEHHDGFALYDSALSDWTAAKMGPKRDLIGELAAAVRRQWLVFGLSSHRAEHWWFMDGGMQFDSDVQDGRYAAFYGPAQPRGTQPHEAYLEDWLARCCELVDKYRPQLFWFDWWIEEPAFAPYLRRFAAYYYNRAAQWGRGVAINYKHQAFPEAAAVYDIERGQLTEIRERFWQTDTSISKNSWGYVQNQDYRTARALIGDLVDIVSKNGALLLNIGPRPDGTIPEPEREILLEIGRWLAINGEAIYATRPWRVYGEGPTQVMGGSFADTQRAEFGAEDVRFTIKGDALYAIVLGWPERGEVTIRSLGEGLALYGKSIDQVALLGYGNLPAWARRPEGLAVPLPAREALAHAELCGHGFALKITSK
jgi:alpha-L-fucosidase